MKTTLSSIAFVLLGLITMGPFLLGFIDVGCVFLVDNACLLQWNGYKAVAVLVWTVVAGRFAVWVAECYFA